MTAIAEPTALKTSRLDRLRQRLAEPIEAFTAIWHNRALRRLEYAWVGSIVGTWAFGTALGVYAYTKGGAAAVGLAGLIRMLPTVFFAPFVSSLGDRYPRVAVMVGSDLVRGFFFVVAGLVIVADGPPLVVYILGGLIVLSASCFRPAQAALLPSLTDTPEQLTAMNVVSSTVESVGFFAGPALGGILYAATNAETVFFASAASCLWSAGMLLGVRKASAQAAAAVEADTGETEEEKAEGGGFFRESVEGYRTIGRDKNLLIMVSLFTGQTIVAGALNVFIVVLALHLYKSGPTGVGSLNAAIGVGGILGAGAAAALIGGNRKLAKGFAFGMVFWGVPLLFMGGIPVEVVGLLALVVLGVANTVIDVSAFTLLQRAVPDEVLARVFGVLETVLLAGMALGAIITPLLIHALGVRGALLVVGTFLPTLTFLTYSSIRSFDRLPAAPAEDVALLSSLSLFKPFPADTVRVLAAKLKPHEVEADATVVREGEAGDLFYVIKDGEFSVAIGGKPCAELGPGDFFGEIALLRDCARTATVTAVNGGGTLLSLTRDDFVPAMRMELLKSLPLFRPLPPPTLEFLASKLEYEQLAAGDVVMTQGEEGDRFYIVAEGSLDVYKDGELCAGLVPGEFFGEIALLRNTPRTATVKAREDAVVFSLKRDDFVPAVTGSAPSNAAADEVVGARLGALANRPALRA